MPERVPQERETLIFTTPEEAQQFRERVAEQLAREPIRGVVRGREKVADEVAAEFAKHGEAAGVLTLPWEHTPEEHNEVQELVDLAFARDLEAALRRAKGSRQYPRTIDLLHDVLTTELYTLLQQRDMNKAPVMARLVMMGIVVLAAILLVMLVLVVL